MKIEYNIPTSAQHPYRMKIQSVLYGNIKNYRINICKITKQPTEDKYSMAPLFIKGFLPQQNGSAIMLPAEITTLSGSDFDKLSMSK